MFARTFFRGILLGLLILQTLASAAEATVCKPCPEKSAAACPSLSDKATMSDPFSEDRTDSPPSTSNDGGDDHCSVCPLCLSPFIETASVSVSPDNQGQRFASAAPMALYEAPSFSLLRPPIA